MIYKFRTRMGKGLDPSAVGTALEQIRTTHAGHLLPEDVVTEAADDKSPLHAAFTWDDAKAAHEFRLREARFLIRNVLVAASEDETPTPAYYNVSVKRTDDESDRYYQSSVVIAQSPVEFDAALRLMKTELAGAEIGLQQLLRIAPKPNAPRIKRAAAHVVEAHRLLELSPG